MTTSPNRSPESPREALRLQLSEAPAAGSPDGAWWPRSRDLQVEGPHLVDEFPDSVGRINRMLFSRPDWDDSARRAAGSAGSRPPGARSRSDPSRPTTPT